MQSYTSSATSINSTKLPAVFKRATFSAELVLDLGSGKYTAHIDEYIRNLHKVYLPYDPYNQPEEINRHTITMVVNAYATRFPVDVVCSNVLNVIDDDETVRKIARHIEGIVTTTGGTGFVTVYEGNRSGTGRQTGADQYQRNEPLRNYLRYFHNARIEKGMIVVGR